MSDQFLENEKNSRIKLISVLVGLGLIVGLGIYYFFARYEYFEEPQYLGFSQQARENPFLAAEQHLGSLDIAVDSTTELQALDNLEADGLLVMFDSNSVLNQRSAEQVVEWMKAGGRVVVAAQMYTDVGEEDVLLSQFGVTKHFADDGYMQSMDGVEVDENGFIAEDGQQISNGDSSDDTDESKEEKDESNNSNFDDIREAFRKTREQLSEVEQMHDLDQRAAQENWGVAEKIRAREAWAIKSNLVEINFDNASYSLLVDYSGSGSLYHPDVYEEDWDDVYEDEYYDSSYDDETYYNNSDYEDISYEYSPFYWVQNENAIGLMQFEVGEGLLTVMADINIFTSSQIGLFDHALLLESLAEDASKVTFLFGADVPNLLELIWSYFFETCIASLMLLFFWILFRSRRFGPIRNDVYASRRSFQEHLSAVGEYVWRQENKDEMLESVRNEIWLAMKKRFADFDRLNQNQKIEKLAAVADIEASQITKTMTSKISNDEIYFFQQIKSLQKLRKQL